MPSKVKHLEINHWVIGETDKRSKYVKEYSDIITKAYRTREFGWEFKQ